MKIKKYFRNIGPGAIITAAFIGPGTITTCIKAGYEEGYLLMGIMIFAIIVAMIIQIFAAKVGIITQMGISKNIRESAHSAIEKNLSILLITIAIFIGNTAFEAGNISGATIGLSGMIGNNVPNTIEVLIITIIIFGLLWNGSYKKMEFLLEIMVLAMAICFVIVAILVNPNMFQIIKGIFNFRIFQRDSMLIGALIGTTVGPYSIFLHSDVSAERWHSTDDLKYMIFDTIISIGIGGIISCCIMTAAATIGNNLQITELTVGNFAMALSIPIGRIGQFIFYLGLLAAGVTSAITAPLAAAYTIVGISFSQKVDKQCWNFRIVWIFVLVIGAIISIIWGNSPAEIIVIVQIANALILPFIMIFLYKCLNNRLMKKYKNRIGENIILVFMITICFWLSFQNIYRIFTI